MNAVAVIPAAGASSRMGEQKLLLPWAGRTVIESLISAWQASLVDEIFVVVHPENQQLADAVAGSGATVVRPPQPPPEMKASVQVALSAAALLKPRSWLLAPADMPWLSSGRRRLPVASRRTA